METLQQQTFQFGGGELTSSQRARLVSHFRLLEKEKAQMMLDISGRKLLERYEKFNHNGSFLKMFPALLIGQKGWFSNRSLLTWKMKGTKFCRFYFQLVVSTLRTKENAFGSLLKTPTVMDGQVSSGKANPVSGDSGSLAQEIMSGYPPTMEKLGLLPTPDCSDRRGPGSKQQGLSNVMKGLLPTPTAVSDLKGGCTRPNPKRQNDTLAHAMHGESNAQPGTTSQLNPRFVAEMMGYPTTWLVLPFLSGETKA